MAWKRIYLEIDQMYQKGATLTQFFTPVEGNADDVLSVDNSSDFEEGSDVVIFNRGEPPIETKVVSKSADTITVKHIVPRQIPKPYPSTGTWAQDFPKYSGVRLKNDISTLPNVSTKFLTQAYGQSTDGSDGGNFFEFVEDHLAGWNVPKYSQFSASAATDFSARWFKYGTNNNNIFQLLTAHPGNIFDGVANLQNNTAMVLMINEGTSAKTAVHELGHLCDLVKDGLGRHNPGLNDHVDKVYPKPVHIGNPTCYLLKIRQKWDFVLSKVAL